MLPGQYRFVIEIINNQKEEMNLIDRFVEYPYFYKDTLTIRKLKLVFPAYHEKEKIINSDFSIIAYPPSRWDKKAR